MNEEYLENDTPKNEEVAEPKTDETPENVEETVKKEVYENQKIRAEKAEAELKKLKAEAETETPKKENKSDDYNDRIDRLSLKSEGITNSDDQDLVLKEAKRLNLPVEEILKEDYMKSKLKTLATQRAAEDGLPDSSGKKGGGTKNSVDYWIDRKNKDGGYENPTDMELAIKVVNARMERERRKQEFPD
jgi:hypothetical protein